MPTRLAHTGGSSHNDRFRTPLRRGARLSAVSSLLQTSPRRSGDRRVKGVTSTRRPTLFHTPARVLCKGRRTSATPPNLPPIPGAQAPTRKATSALNRDSRNRLSMHRRIRLRAYEPPDNPRRCRLPLSHRIRSRREEKLANLPRHGQFR